MYTAKAKPPAAGKVFLTLLCLGGSALTWAGITFLPTLTPEWALQRAPQLVALAFGVVACLVIIIGLRVKTGPNQIEVMVNRALNIPS